VTELPKDRLAQATLNRILEMIWREEFPRGSRLPSERDFAAQIQVSRPTLRGAIKVLEALGIVEVRHGSGVRVTGEKSPLSARVLTQMLDRDEALILELIEARMDFESQNANLAAKHATNEDIRHLGEVFQDMVADFEAQRPGVNSDVNFHLTVAEATHNRVRLFITSTMFLSHIVVLQESRQRLTSETRNAAKLLDQHREIYFAVKYRDFDRAEQAMRNHLESSYRMNLALARVAKTRTVLKDVTT
jgi:GntR family transcriptional repressor for pyruvate dehydrogenase complex